jgi:hypothetical protein
MIDSGFDPAVIPIITRVAELAGIKDSTLVVSQDGQTFTVQEKFELDMIDVIKTVHWRADDDPSRLKKAKKTRKLAGQLEEALHQDGNLLRYLPFSDVRAVSNLVNELYKLERDKKRGRSKKWGQTIREQFVSGLLDAAALAGGELGVNMRNGRGSLVDAVELLKPFLPELFQHERDGLSASTLKTLKAAWAKNRKK